nr:hypothetical protein Q903MT_gene237 [Picea sitchensis]
MSFLDNNSDSMPSKKDRELVAAKRISGKGQVVVFRAGMRIRTLPLLKKGPSVLIRSRCPS